MKTLPKLTAAQQAAWERVLEWYALDNRGEYFESFGMANHIKVGHYLVAGSKSTFAALVSKGLLIAQKDSNRPVTGADRYTIAPDYLPAPAPEVDASDQDAAPVEDEFFMLGQDVTILVGEAMGEVGYISKIDCDSNLHLPYRVTIEKTGYYSHYAAAELAPVASEPGEPEAVNVFERGDMVRTKPVSAGIPFEVSSTYTSPVTGKTYVRGRVNGEPTSYFVDELELAPSEPEAVDEGRVNEFKDTMADSPSNAVNRYSGLLQEFRDLENENTELKLEVQRKANENASLQGQLEALRVYAAELDRKLKRSQTALETSHTAGYASGYNEGRTELEAENARLRVFLTAIKDEAETDLGEWLGVAFDQVFPSKQAMKAIYEGARDALDPPADNS